METFCKIMPMTRAMQITRQFPDIHIICICGTRLPLEIIYGGTEMCAPMKLRHKELLRNYSAFPLTIHNADKHTAPFIALLPVFSTQQDHSPYKQTGIHTCLAVCPGDSDQKVVVLFVEKELFCLCHRAEIWAARFEEMQKHTKLVAI